MAEIGKMWIKCRVRPGMFSDELTVEVNGRSFFVNVGSVRKRVGDEGEVEVNIVEIDNKKWAEMPTNTRETVPLPA